MYHYFMLKKYMLLLIFLFIFLTGCDDTVYSVQCYSGGKLIYDGVGRVVRYSNASITITEESGEEIGLYGAECVLAPEAG